MLEKEYKFKCEDCESEVVVPKDVENGEIISCKNCGLEYCVWLTSEGIKISSFEFIKENFGE